MRLLLILLLLLQTNSLKANEINYLLNIPNLEIYKLNNTNGLKYLSAKKNFKIGINNNISCDKATKESLDKSFYDQILPVSSMSGIDWAKKLAQKEGIITGISGGATFAIAMQIANSAPAGSVILCMLPDTAERYLSSPLFETIESEMDSQETRISQSTPGYQLPD